ncbi:MAG: hypothetical protein KA715_06975 [Xanthomonadaceae bacterium]|nr:hypothetical protein [Xanthomonadaceae bacterium]
MKFLTTITASAILISGCSGYHLRGDKNEYLEERGVHKVYLAPVTNQTFKAGTENGLYNAMIRKISAYKIIELVPDPESADAILEGTVTGAVYTSDLTQTTPASNLKPINTLTPDLQVTLQYFATLSSSFTLTRTKIKKLGQAPEVVWSSGFTRSKAFASNNQGGMYGVTASHINESEFDRTLAELTDLIADDAHEGMVSMF